MTWVVQDRTVYRVYGKTMVLKRDYSYTNEEAARSFMQRVGKRAQSDEGAVEVILTLRRDGEPVDEWNVTLASSTEIEAPPEPRYNDDI